jgi:4-carboxymuconolactone decarboxylase
MNPGVRVPPVTPGARPEQGDIERAILAGRGRISLLYQVLLNNPVIAEGWEKMLTAVRKRSSLPASVRELVILRVAVLNDAPYEFESHVPHAELAGVSAEKIAAARDGHPGVAFTPQERIALELTNAMTRTVRVPDALFARLRDHLDDRGLVGLVATVATYNMVSRFLVALNIGHRMKATIAMLMLRRGAVVCERRNSRTSPT